jgi:hypothetical protein
MSTTDPPNNADAVSAARRAGVFATQRQILAKRVADAPALWMSIPAWARLFSEARRLLGFERRSAKGR